MPSITENGETIDDDTLVEKKDVSISETCEEISKEDQISKLKLKCEALEELSSKLKSKIPNIQQFSRPIQLSIIQDGFVYELTIPDQALNSLESFPKAHSILSKFSALLAQMEANAATSIEKEKQTKSEEK